MSNGGGMLKVERLRELRDSQALSQDELAQKSGLSRQTIARIEAGKPAIPKNVRKIAAALGVAPAALLRAKEGEG